MTVKIVTDSVSDIPPDLAQELGITVVPLYVRFGDKIYRDAVDLTTDEFYYELEHNPNFPATSTLSPQDFANIYEKLAEESDEIVSIHLSTNYSATYEVALLSKNLVKKSCRIEVIDSKTAIGGQAFVVIAAAQAAQTGAKFDEVVKAAHQTMPRVHVRMAFDTLEYLKRGGRIGKAQAFLGSLLKINPVIGIKDGDTYPYAKTRGRAKSIKYLYDFVESFAGRIKSLAIEHATTPNEAEMVAESLNPVFPKEQIYRFKVSPVVGTHVGPHVIAVTILEKVSAIQI